MKPFFSMHLILVCWLIGCTSAPINYQPFPLSNIQTDFPECDTLKFEEFNTYNIFDAGYVEIKDSILWVFNIVPEEQVGFCYNLYTKEKYSSIATIGRAANELDDQFSQSFIANDSIYFFFSRTNTIKSVAQKDIINNVPSGERKFSETILPDSLPVVQLIKLPNGATMAMNSFNYRQIVLKKNEDINFPFIAIINNNNVQTYPVINYNSHRFKMHNEHHLSSIDFIKHSYAHGNVSCKNDSLAVFSVNNQVILYTLDLTNGKVINEKRYTEIKCETPSFSSSNDLNLFVSQLDSNDKYIFCIVEGYMNEVDKIEKKRKKTLLVFDWDLNPIKCFSLSSNSFYFFPKDNSSTIFERKLSEDGLTLYKASFF